MKEKKLTDEEIVSIDWHNEQVMQLHNEIEELRKAKVVHETIDYCYEDLKKAQAEIERLKEYNLNLNGMNLELIDKNAELQNQVDELKFDKELLQKLIDKREKDTAKEILQWFESRYPKLSVREYFAQRYGVEVE